MEADAIDRLWAKLKDQFGSRDTYPKPYIKMTDADWRELQIYAEKHKPNMIYMRITTKIFRAILSQDYLQAVAIVDLVHSMNPGFKREDRVNIDLIRDSGRILSLKLCSLLAQHLVLMQNNQENCVTLYTQLLLKLMSFQSPEDRHRKVISNRVQEMLNKNLGASRDQIVEIVKATPGNMEHP